MTWPAFYRMPPGTFATGVNPQGWRAAKGESSPRALWAVAGPEAFLWRSRTPDSGNRPKTRRFGACYVLKVNLNVLNMHGPQGLDSVELHTSQKELVGIGLRKKINLGVGIRGEVSSRASSSMWVRTLEDRTVRNRLKQSRWCRTNGEPGYHACAGDFTRAVLPLAQSSKRSAHLKSSLPATEELCLLRETFSTIMGVLARSPRSMVLVAVPGRRVN